MVGLGSWPSSWAITYIVGIVCGVCWFQVDHDVLDN
jgi:hypothetical protein